MKSILLNALLFCSLTIHAQSRGTLLVGNKDDNTVSFIDLKQQKVVKTVPVGAGPHEVAVSPSGKMAVVANYGNRQQSGHSISVIDVAKKQVIKEIELGEYLRPHGMEFINETEVVVTSEVKRVLLRVNITTGAVSEVAKTDQLTSHMVTYSRDAQKAYVANINSGTVSVIDVKDNKLVQHIILKPGVEGLSVSPNGKELWVANQKENITSVINTSTLQTIKEFPAQLIAYRVGFLPNGKYAAVSNGSSGNVSIYDAVNKQWIKDIDLVAGDVPGSSVIAPVPGGITASADSEWMFVCTTGRNQVVVINTKTWTVSARIETGKGPDGIYYSIID